MSDSTYANVYSNTLNVYNLTNDALLGSVSLNPPSDHFSYYLDKKGQQVFYLNQEGWSQDCSLKVLDLTTGKTRTLDYKLTGDIWVGSIIQVKNTNDTGKPDMVFKISDQDYITLTAAFGQVPFEYTNGHKSTQIIVNFDVLSVNVLAFDDNINLCWTAYLFTYDTSSQKFFS